MQGLMGLESRRMVVVAVLAALLLMNAGVAEGRTGNYLIIAPPAYNGSAPLNQFVTSRTAEGFDVTVYEVPSGTTNSAIKSYVESLWGTASAPKYILLVGDTSGTTSSQSTIPHFVGQGSKSADTDLPYGCMGGTSDWYPEIPVGRFSVNSVTQLQDVVNKTLFVEAGSFPNPDYTTRGAFLANPSTYGMAEPTHDWVIDNYFTPNGYEGVKLYSSQGAGTADVTNAINEGCLFCVYFGHSSSSGWWDPSFDQGDVNALSNTGLYGLAFGWSCNTAHFSYDECFGETWLRAPNKGAAAYISASNYIYWGSVEAWTPSAVHEKSFFASFFEKDIWEVGPAWQEGLYRFLRDYGQWDGNPAHPPAENESICRNFFEEFVLLGDPALLLPQPDGFALSADPESYDLCSPPANEAVYTVTVGQLGEFSESVTLDTVGVPTGATASFDVNSQPPPFTSELTIGNLTAVATGNYSIIVRGTSATMQRSTPVGLNLASGVPGSVSLTSPPNGASGVYLKPLLEWEPLAGASSYDVELATDSGFTEIIESASTSDTEYTVTTSLDPLMLCYWHVRATNTCGTGSYCPPFTFTTGNMIAPASYDLLNGETGSYSYFDDAYDGSGDNTVPLASLSGGLGDLTDGVLATEHWNDNNIPYVGWKSIEPTITFHFDGPLSVEAVTIHVDDSGGGGGVVPPSDVTISMGGTTLSFEVVDPAGSEPFAATFGDLGLAGSTLELTLEDDGFTTSRYLMLSEVEIYGGSGSELGACCVGESCAAKTAVDCLAQAGEFLGVGTDCEPNPCAEYEFPCVFISEVVYGAESGGCPRWIEITNSGLNDFAFIEGGIIVQEGSSSDFVVDVDLSDVVIPAGVSFVVDSTMDGDCAGAYEFIYGTAPDLQTDVLFGDGDDRYILTDAADGGHQLDIYGEFGVDGTGEEWEYTEGYAYRLAAYNNGSGVFFAPGEWEYGGVGSLGAGSGDPTQLLLDHTTPAIHVYDENCVPWGSGDLDGDADVDLEDYLILCACLAGPGETTPPGGCSATEFANADLEEDGDVDLADFVLFEFEFAGN